MDVIWSVLQELFTPQDGWTLRFLVRVVLSTVLLYVWVVMIARTFGGRTFASFTSYDFLINIAAGSLVASSIMGRNLVEGSLAVLLLAALQWATSYASARADGFHQLVDNPPVVLIAHGEINEAAMRKVRVSHQTLMQQLRNKGAGEVGQIRYAILESGGTISVIKGDVNETMSTYPDRQRPEQNPNGTPG